MKKTSKIISAILSLVLVFSLFGCSGETGTTSTATREPSATFKNGIDVGEDYDKKYTSLLDGSKILDVQITIQESYLAEILDTPEKEQFYSADIKVDNEMISKAGFRTSGNTDFSDSDEGFQDRYSFKIKFDKYVEKQKFLKLDEMSLINLNNDPSYLRYYLALKAFEYLNADAPLASFAKVSINGKNWGLYLAVEGIDDAYLKRTVGNNDGNLYKADSGCNLLGALSLSLLSQKNGSDKTLKDIEDLINVLNSMPSGEKGDIESVLDVDSALKYIAVCSVLGITKSYIGKSCENFYLASKEGKFVIVPWNLKSAFGGAGKDNGASVNVSPYEPVYRTTMEERPLINNLLSVDEYCKKYEDYISKLTEFLEKITTEIEKADKLIDNEVKNEKDPFFSYEQYKIQLGSDGTNSTGIITVAEYAKLRAEYLRSLNF